ncbi:MAG: PTS glucose transporter subunit IIA [Coprobacillus sp.]
MGLFSKKTKAFYAMANGTSVAIEDVPDEVFSTKMMGEGIAIIPSDGKIHAPCAGKVTMLMDNTKHAVGIENEDGIEVLIHVGLDTVNLMGEGLQAHVEVGDELEVGDLLISYDKDKLTSEGINDITMLVVVSDNNHKMTKFHTNQQVSIKKSTLIEYK